MLLLLLRVGGVPSVPHVGDPSTLKQLTGGVWADTLVVKWNKWLRVKVKPYVGIVLKYLGVYTYLLKTLKNHMSPSAYHILVVAWESS